MSCLERKETKQNKTKRNYPCKIISTTTTKEERKKETSITGWSETVKYCGYRMDGLCGEKYNTMELSASFPVTHEGKKKERGGTEN
jgi:hypothetical protein